MEKICDVDCYSNLFKIVGESPPATVLMVFGLVLLLVGVGCSFKAIRSDAGTVKLWVKCLLFGSLALAVVFTLGGAALAVMSASNHQKIDSAAVLAHIRDNSPARWLIRLIPYDSVKTPELSIGRLVKLGPPDQLYSFVADYAELRGYTASEAVQRAGGAMTDATRVSAVIFPVRGELYPANARGVLQVIDAIDRAHTSDAAHPYIRFDKLQSSLTKADLDDLARTQRISSWSFKSYGKYYGDYCAVAQEFRCSKTIEYSAKQLVGTISPDWYPLGFARKDTPPPDPCLHQVEACEVTNWDQTASLESIVGARVFLIKNVTLDSLDGRILIDFDNPDTQVIPDIGRNL
jgi:hypothetical protein